MENNENKDIENKLVKVAQLGNFHKIKQQT